MAAKKKEVRTLTLDDIGVGADDVGLANANSKVFSAAPRPAKSAGEKVSDEGDGGTKIAEYLVAQKIIYDYSKNYWGPLPTGDRESLWLKYSCSSSTPKVR